MAPNLPSTEISSLALAGELLLGVLARAQGQPVKTLHPLNRASEKRGWDQVPQGYTELL